MKCHYENCQEDAYRFWIYTRLAVPLCTWHADGLHAMVPLPNVHADDLQAENLTLANNIQRAMAHVRSDDEWSAEGDTHDTD